MTDTQELEADRFFATKLFAGADKRSRQNLYAGVTQFIFTAVSLAFSAKESRAVLAPSVDGIHPPWLIRALRLGEHMNSIDPDAGGSDFYQSIGSRVEVRRGGLELSSFCDFKNIREIAAKNQEQRLRDSDKN